MTVARLKTAADAIADKNVSNEVLASFGQRVIAHWQNEFDAYVADPENPTNDEQAGFVLKKILDFIKDVNRAEARKSAAATVQATIDTAESDADGEWI